jgi:hypothetical protein
MAAACAPLVVGVVEVARYSDGSACRWRSSHQEADGELGAVRCCEVGPGGDRAPRHGGGGHGRAPRRGGQHCAGTAPGFHHSMCRVSCMQRRGEAWDGVGRGRMELPEQVGRGRCFVQRRLRVAAVLMHPCAHMRSRLQLTKLRAGSATARSKPYPSGCSASARARLSGHVAGRGASALGSPACESSCARATHDCGLRCLCMYALARRGSLLMVGDEGGRGGGIPHASVLFQQEPKTPVMAEPLCAQHCVHNMAVGGQRPAHLSSGSGTRLISPSSDHWQQDLSRGVRHP